jgi:iron complex transport system ATP-binding protein
MTKDKEIELIRYRKETAKRKILLESANIAIKKGSMVALLGLSGEGKTQLLEAMAGLSNHRATTSGAVRVNEEGSMVERDVVEWHKKVNYVTQKTLPYTTEKVRDLVNFVVACTGADRAEVFNLIDVLKMEKVLETPVNKLSGGEEKRLHLLLSFIKKAPFNIYDEPISGLDSAMSHSVLNMLRKNGSTNVLSIHHFSPAYAKYFDDVILIDSAKIIYCGPLFEFPQFLARLGVVVPESEFVYDYVLNVCSGNAKGGKDLQNKAIIDEVTNGIYKGVCYYTEEPVTPIEGTEPLPVHSKGEKWFVATPFTLAHVLFLTKRMLGTKPAGEYVGVFLTVFMLVFMTWASKFGMVKAFETCNLNLSLFKFLVQTGFLQTYSRNLGGPSSPIIIAMGFMPMTLNAMHGGCFLWAAVSCLSMAAARVKKHYKYAVFETNMRFYSSLAFFAAYIFEMFLWINAALVATSLITHFVLSPFVPLHWLLVIPWAAVCALGVISCTTAMSLISTNPIAQTFLQLGAYLYLIVYGSGPAFFNMLSLAPFIRDFDSVLNAIRKVEEAIIFTNPMATATKFFEGVMRRSAGGCGMSQYQNVAQHLFNNRLLDDDYARASPLTAESRTALIETIKEKCKALLESESWGVMDASSVPVMEMKNILINGALMVIVPTALISLVAFIRYMKMQPKLIKP